MEKRLDNIALGFVYLEKAYGTRLGIVHVEVGGCPRGGGGDSGKHV